MKALTLTQPWATLIVLGLKRIENRPWKPPANMIGQRFAIHASREIDESALASIPRYAIDTLQDYLRSRGPMPISRIVATARLVRWTTDMPEDHRDWWAGPYGFVLDDIVPVDLNVPVKGALSFWRLPDDVDAMLGAEHR